MKKFYLIIIFLFSITVLFLGCRKEKKGVIYGVVTDYTTGEPVYNANVKLRPIGETTLTGSDGAYQFNNVENGDYTLSLSKAGYSDLDDDYTITVNGNNVRRDVQLIALYQSFRVTLNGIEIDTLDFGIDPSLTKIVYSIENNGTVSISPHIQVSSNWMIIQSSSPGSISMGNSRSCEISVKREYLARGVNIGFLYISAGNYTKTIVVKAIGVSPPVLAEPILLTVGTNTSTVQSSIIDNGGGDIIDRGFVYRLQANVGYYGTTTVTCGPGEGDFQTQIQAGTEGYTGHQVRAYADNGVYIGYSVWVCVNCSK